MENRTILGIDLGGTHLRGGWVNGNTVSHINSQRISPGSSAEEMLQFLFSFTDHLVTDSVKAIGIGVPGPVVNGVVYDVVNIPSWKEIALRLHMEDRYHIPVRVNNDANCFSLGEFYFGKGKGHGSMVGLAIGTGLGCGLIINGKLYEGMNGGAGEFGMMEYLDQTFEYYASGQFFRNVYALDGEAVFQQALQGESRSLELYREFGTHLGNCIRAILFALDTDLIVLGGSVRKAYPFFSRTMWQSIQEFPFKRSVTNLKIEVSDLSNSGIMGAAALCFDS